MEYIEISYSRNEGEIIQYGNNCNNLPFASSQLYRFPIKSAQYLSHGEDVKTIIEITLNMSLPMQFEPGDTIGILPQNNEEEVNEIISLLDLIDESNKIICISASKNTKKKNVSLPSHIPVITTIRSLFRNNVDIRAIPKKSFLRMLSKYATNTNEIQQLSEACETPSKYEAFLKESPYLVQILNKFKSCKPPIDRLLEHLPSLKPRPYSISSSPLNTAYELTFVISVLEMNNSFKGVCTSWLQCLTDKIIAENNLEVAIPVYFRKANNFRLPKDSSTPIIMIGPGTGVSPFLGFLRHRYLQRKCGETNLFGSSCLYFGCRYHTRDFLFEEELEKYLEDGTLNELHVAFSRGEGEKSYVQQLIMKNDEEFIKKLLDENCILYVCGDRKNMGVDVKNAVKICIENVRGYSEIESLEVLRNLQQESRYIEDLWA